MCYYEENDITSDVFRVINKFDIYLCDLGFATNSKDNNTLNKSRPCVVVTSNDLNCIFSNQFVVAPVRTVHNENVTEDNIEEYINKERSVGRICIPVKMNDVIRVIDMNQIRQIPNSKIYKYLGTIINNDVRKNINAGLMELLFSRNEFIENNNENIRKRNVALQNNLDEVEIDKVEEILNVPVQEEPVESEPIKEESEFVVKRGGRGRKLKFSTGFSLCYRAWADGKMTTNEIAERCNIHVHTVCNHIKKYHELHPEIEIKVKNKLIKN